MKETLSDYEQAELTRKIVRTNIGLYTDELVASAERWEKSLVGRVFMFVAATIYGVVGAVLFVVLFVVTADHWSGMN